MGDQRPSRRPFFSKADIELKRQRREAALGGLADLAPLAARYAEGADRTCPKCGDAKNNNRLYCYKCIVPVGGLVLPRVSLPIKLDVVRHVKESRSKSTALHALVLGRPGDVRVVETPEVDTLGPFDPARTLLLYPSKDAVTLKDMGDSLRNFDRIVVVDSTWQQAASVLRMPQLAGLKHIKLQASYSTAFWRYQSKGDEFLATIEAIHFFFREWQQAMSSNEEEYDGRFDNLLYIFVGMLRMIEEKKTAAAAESAAADEEECCG